MALLEVCLLCVVVVGFLVYRWSTANYKVFAERGVPHEKPLPLLGNALPMLKQKISLHKVMIGMYRRTKQHKIYGYYHLRNPIFIINDPELIRQIGVKEFSSFINHQGFIKAKHDRIFSNLLSTLRDQRWKNMRNTLTPIFTSAKMRAMFPLMLECFGESVSHLHSKSGGADGFDVELKDCFARLSSDLIATTAFGLQVNSFTDEKNDFYTLGTAICKPKKSRLLKLLLISALPKLAEVLKLMVIDGEKAKYFVRLVVDAMKYREQHNIHRPDMIGLLMEAQKESPHHWTQEEIVAQCFIFFFAAFQNNANLLCITCQLLMENPDAQDRLHEEIVAVTNQLQGQKLDYDTINGMEYMDMVALESLRKWAISPLLGRVCGKDHSVRDAEGNLVCELKEGDRIWLQLIGLHWADEFFPDPEDFIPERFSKENKSRIKPFTYLPFGLGPRNCIGSRYALMQGKAMLFYLLREFRIERSVKSCTNLLDELVGFDFAPKNGFWFKLTKR